MAHPETARFFVFYDIGFVKKSGRLLQYSTEQTCEFHEQYDGSLGRPSDFAV